MLHPALCRCLVLHPTPPTTPATPAQHNSTTSTDTSTASSSSSSSSRWQLSLRANWSAATLPDASSLTQQQQQQQKAEPAGPSTNASSHSSSTSGGDGGSGGAVSTAVAAMHGWQLQCSGRVELMAPACSTASAASAGATSNAFGSGECIALCEQLCCGSYTVHQCTCCS
jgi:hypothetical protein